MSDPGSHLDQLAGYVLLLELLQEDRKTWLRLVESSMTDAELASDEAFLAWVETECARDPALITRTRRVLERFRKGVIGEWRSGES